MGRQQCLVKYVPSYDPSNQQGSKKMLLLSQNPTGGGTFDKVSYSPRKWSSLRKGVAHSCGKREIMEDIFSRGNIRYDQTCLRYIKDTSDLLWPHIKRTQKDKVKENVFTKS